MKLRMSLLTLAAVALLSFSVQSAAASVQDTARVEKQVTHELNMLPYVNVFDYMSFSVDADGVVTLNGTVTNPVVKTDAASAVKRVEGVEHVNNQIQVLPVSFYDNGLRVRLFRTIYGDPALQRYALGLTKPIRIIVQNGHVTLLGVVDSEMDKALAGLRANGVPGIFSVDNQLRVVRG